MPEGPELHLASVFINRVCKDRIFSGAITKSTVSLRQPEVPWNAPQYKISAESRGKEIKLCLCETNNELRENDKPKTMSLVFRFGMSGNFKFSDESKMHKHAHLNFFTADNPRKVLSYVDIRRFGGWNVSGDWQADRGPCVLFEYERFRKHVLENIEDAAFKKPICEVLLNQKYFNGVGNYLRAEILYRLNIQPFVSAHSVLEPIVTDEDFERPVKKEKPDIIDMCNILALEVVALGVSVYGDYREAADTDDNKEKSLEEQDLFTQWLQCYYKPGMKNVNDHNKRTVWFSGSPGPMVPKDAKINVYKASAPAKEKRKIKKENDTADEPVEEKKAKKKPTTKKVKNIKKEHEISDSESNDKPESLDNNTVENGDHIENVEVKTEPNLKKEQLKPPMKKAKSLPASYSGPVKVGAISPRKTRSFTRR